MFHDLATGTLLVALTVLIHTAGLLALTQFTPPIARRLGFHSHAVGKSLVMIGSVLGLFLLHTLEIWLWAAVYDLRGVVAAFPQALELSTSMFSTLGYDGSEGIAPSRRLLTALEGINGFILIGWSTAYLVSASTRHGPFRVEHF